jgi:hypothetical protein
VRPKVAKDGDLQIRALPGDILNKYCEEPISWLFFRREDNVAFLVLSPTVVRVVKFSRKAGDEAKGISCCPIKFRFLEMEHYVLF